MRNSVSRGFRPSRRLILAIALVGLAWRVAVAFPIYNAFRPGTESAGDADLYLALAENLRAGRGYTIDPTPPHEPFVFRPPVYPLFLAGTLAMSGGSHVFVLIVQAVLDLATGLLLYFLARRLWPAHPERAFAAALAWAACPVAGSYAGRLSAEVLATFLTTGGILGLAAAGRSLAAGFRLGAGALGGTGLMLATLARPQLFPAVLAIPLLAAALTRNTPGRRARAAAAVIASALVGVLLIEAPWVIRNQRSVGEPVLLAGGLGELVFAMGVTGEPRGETMAEAEDRLRAEGLDLPRDPAARRRDRARILKFAMHRIGEHPLRYLAVSLRRAVLLWATPRTAIYGLTPKALRSALHHPRGPGAIAILLVAGTFGLYYLGLLVLAGLGALRARDPALWAILAALPIGVTVTIMWLYLEARNLVPTYPAIVLAAAYPLGDLLAGHRRMARARDTMKHSDKPDSRG